MVRRMNQDNSPLSPRDPRNLTWLVQRSRHFFTDYFWLIIRNIIGWVLILAALPIGFLAPGPFGFPLFLIGFALVTFPGKRRLTSRVLRGRRLRLEHPFYTTVAAVVAILVPGIAFWIIGVGYEDQVRHLIEIYAPKKIVYFLIPLLLIAVTWLLTRLSLRLLNLLLLSFPRIRRKIRPWLRRRGFNVLPPRSHGADEILELDPSYQRGIQTAWDAVKRWIWRTAGAVITIAIFFYIFRKVALHWNDVEVRRRVLATSIARFVLAAGMFAVFLFVFRVISWRRIIKGFGHRLPMAAATRIWTLSELARYLPGSVWQVVGRAYLVKPYGVNGSISSTAQILELTMFLLANVLFAVACFLFLGTKKLGEAARPWLFGAMFLVPLLAVLLHPRIFYGIANRILARLGKPAITQRLRGKKLVALLAWAVIGLLWQSIAVWILLEQPLHLRWEKWWMVGGAYSLAWCAGFLAVWAPGGLAVREVVFMAALLVALPTPIRSQFESRASLAGMLAFLSLLLRLWTIVGELMLTIIGAAADYRGLLGVRPQDRNARPTGI
jgi:uncharacterized membrane protein YbhN (UPF0104 family)